MVAVRPGIPLAAEPNRNIRSGSYTSTRRCAISSRAPLCHCLELFFECRLLLLALVLSGREDLERFSR